MRTLRILFCGLFSVLLSLTATWAAAQVSGGRPSMAFDPVNHHYLMVWEENAGSGYQIMGKLLNPDGTDAGTPQLLSPDRPQQGCFYQNFDSDNGPVTTPSNCPDNRNPSVAYNDGKFLIVWDVAGAAAAPSQVPDNQFAVVFARLVNASDLGPLPGWEEGILVSKIYLAADRPGGCGTSGSFVCEDSNIQAWSQSKNPHVAGRLSGKGFVVTWETNIDFIDCVSADRRDGWSVYGRYLDENFSATSKTNPPLFAIFHDDSTIDPKCATLDNVDNAIHPRIAFNSTSNDFVAVYETARANGGVSSIGAKKITIDATGVGSVSASMMPDVVAAVPSKSLKNPEIISFKGDYILFADDGNKIYSKTFTSDGIANSTPTLIDLGTGIQTNPRAATNLGQGGQGPTVNAAPERILLSYQQSGDIMAVLMDNALAPQGTIDNVSTTLATNNQSPLVSSDQENFLLTWQGSSSGDQVFVKQVTTTTVVPTPTPTPIPTTNPPTAPALDAEPIDGAIWAPTRLYLSWQPATDPDVGDSVTYNVYFVVGTTMPTTAVPYKSGIVDTHFIIQASTDGRVQYEPDSGVTPIYLAANTDYVWKICAKDTQGHETCSGVRQFHTDNSVVGWWRFDEDPVGTTCAGGLAGETVCDYSGKNNHGVPNGSVTWLPPPVLGVLGGVLNFDGVDDYVEVPNSPSLNPSTEITIEVNERLQSLGGILNRPLVQKITAPNAPDNTGYGTTFATSNDYYFGIGNRFINYSIPGVVGVGKNIINTYDGAYAKSYEDGALTFTGNVVGAILPNTQPIWIGRAIHSGSFFGFDGEISEVLIFSRALGPIEIQNSFQTK